MNEETGEITGARRRLFAHWDSASVVVHQDEASQARRTVQAFFAFCIVANSAYTVLYLVSDPSTLGHVLGVNTTTTITFLVAILLARRGRQLAAALIGLSAALIEILVCSNFLGWSVGFHLFLLAAGQLVFMVFTDRQAVYRWLYIGVAAGVFVFCQFFIEYELGPELITPTTREVFFSLNVVGTGLILFGLAAVAHRRGKEAQAEARASTARAEYLANTDALTGLMNRRPVTQELERMERLQAGPYCVVIADLDAFKDLNDTYGHACGDRLLAAVGRSFRTHVRVTDIVGRWGGEEFIFVLPGTAIDDAVRLMERLREGIAGLKVSCGDHPHTITASFGVADGEGGLPFFRVVKRADDAMYDAKAAGRNAVRSRPKAAGDDSPATDVSTRSLRVRGTEK